MYAATSDKSGNAALFDLLLLPVYLCVRVRAWPVSDATRQVTTVVLVNVLSRDVCVRHPVNETVGLCWQRCMSGVH